MTIFEKIVRREIPADIVWEDADGKVWLSYNSAQYLLMTIYGRQGAPTNPEAITGRRDYLHTQQRTQDYLELT